LMLGLELALIVGLLVAESRRNPGVSLSLRADAGHIATDAARLRSPCRGVRRHARGRS